MSSMCCLAFCACLAGEYFIDRASNEQERRIIEAMQARAESLIWALEAGARFFSKKENEPLQELLAEMARQPGIAWIAITKANGIILYDSDMRLQGALLYTAGELARLRPGGRIQGRFAPDDPGIYEAWKLFRPERLARKARKQTFKERKPFYIFVALNTPAFQVGMDENLEKLRLLASLFCGAGLCFLALLFYMRNFLLSRTRLVATEALATKIIANYPGGLLLTDQDGKIIFANRAAEEILNLPDTGGNLSRHEVYDWKSCLEELNSGHNITERELDLRDSEDNLRPVSLSAASIPGESGKRALFILKDLTELRLLQRKLSNSRRLSALGKLAAGVAHEIRNPLSSIRGYSHYLQARLEKDALGKATAGLLVDETRRINEALTDLLALARSPQLNLAKNSLIKIVQKAALLIQPDIKEKKIFLKLDFPQDTEYKWPNTDADKMLQAILNLLLNAVQFSPAGGTIELGLKRIVAEEQLGSGWLISVKDNGPGIAENALSQIFNPYYTSRADGTGLGLSISRQIVESHGGEISVSSAPQKGAFFSIFLPDSAG